MTYEEAIERINDHILIHRYNEPRAIRIVEALQMAISALEKQIPKKVRIEHHPKYGRATFCPNCNRMDVELWDYCPDCGQAIVYTNEEDEDE